MLKQRLCTVHESDPNCIRYRQTIDFNNVSEIHSGSGGGGELTRVGKTMARDQYGPWIIPDLLHP